MLYKSSSWPVVFGPEFEPLLHDINENHPRAPSAEQGKYLLYRFVLSNGGVPGLAICRVYGVVTLGVTKKVPLSGEVRLGQLPDGRLGDLISHNLINCFSWTATFFMLFSTNPAVQPISLVKVRVRCGVGKFRGTHFCSIVKQIKLYYTKYCDGHNQ